MSFSPPGREQERQETERKREREGERIKQGLRFTLELDTSPLGQ